jgi:tripartite-type tricarboxylate transporter receptor subunit TctC
MLVRLVAVLALSFVAALARAQQDYPNRPVRLVIGFAAGSGTDTIGRLTSQSMSKRLGQNFVVENRPGAGGNVAMQYLVAQPADGYTLLIVSPSAGIASAKPNPPYNIERDVTPIVFMGEVAMAFYVSPSLPVRTIQEFIAYAKANPGKLSMASVGVGSLGHLAFEQLKGMQGLNVVHVPYKSSVDAARSVMSGDAHIGLDPFSVLGPLAQAGKVRVLAVASARRHPVAPDTPAMEESGIHDYDMFSWTGFIAPAGLAPAIVQKLNAAYNAVFQEPEVKAYLERAGYRIRGGTSEEFGRYMTGQVATWRKVIAQGKIEFE